MKIAYIHSHLNGHEFLMCHQSCLWGEIEQVINSIDADAYKNKESKEKRRNGAFLYSPSEINKAFKEEFNRAGWSESRQDYYLTPKQDLAHMTMSLPADQQKLMIESFGEKAYYSYNQTDFLKCKVAIEVQFGKYAFVAYDLFVKHMAFYMANQIDVGVEIIPTKRMCEEMSSGIAYYESEVYNVYRQGRNTPAVPLVLVGIEP